MSLEFQRPSLDHALLEQVGSDQAATLIQTWSGGREERVALRPCEAKLLRMLWRERADQASRGFSDPGWVRLAALAREHLRCFEEAVSAHALSQQLYRLRKALGDAAARVVESDGKRGVRLIADLELLLREES